MNWKQWILYKLGFTRHPDYLYCPFDGGRLLPIKMEKMQPNVWEIKGDTQIAWFNCGQCQFYHGFEQTENGIEVVSTKTKAQVECY